jgi:hypothetical protein
MTFVALCQKSFSLVLSIAFCLVLTRKVLAGNVNVLGLGWTQRSLFGHQIFWFKWEIFCVEEVSFHYNNYKIKYQQANYMEAIDLNRKLY